MASTGTSSHISPTDLESFTAHLNSSTRILALLGAGLSAGSGLPTFRGPGGFWRTYDATYLATPGAFRSDPGLVWQFYSYRRSMALNAQPNRAHLALAELARKRPGFLTLSQNVDGLGPRAGHPANQLKLLHGSLFDVKCFDGQRCGYVRRNDFTDPIVPALAMPTDRQVADPSRDLQTGAASANAKASEALQASIATRKNALLKGVDISDVNVPIPKLQLHDLPLCPQCQRELLRPGVVWFGETLPEDVMEQVHDWVSSPEKIDLMLVIGTSSKVYPAAGYTEIARSKGARVAVINMDENDAVGMRDGDWFFGGDAAVIVPELLKSVIGETPEFYEVAKGFSL